MPVPKTFDDALRYNDMIGGSRMVEYDGMMVLVPVRDVRQAMDLLRDGPAAQILASVRTSIGRLFPAVKAGTASQRQAMDCAQDIAIWFAGEVLAGRQTLEIN